MFLQIGVFKTVLLDNGIDPAEVLRKAGIAFSEEEDSVEEASIEDDEEEEDDDDDDDEEDSMEAVASVAGQEEAQSPGEAWG